MAITPSSYDGWYEVDIQGVKGAVEARGRFQRVWQKVNQEQVSQKLFGSYFGLVAACGLRGR